MKQIAVAVALLATLSIRAQMEHHDHDHAADERLGTVVFPVSCNDDVKAQFTRGVALLHSFWYVEAEKAFNDVARRDPQCGMAWWGVAMSNYHEVWPSPYSPAELRRGIAAAEKAKAAGAKTAREKAYIDAIVTFYRDAMTVDTVTRARAYEARMEQLTKDFPDDDEAQIFYGLSLVSHGLSLPTDKTYAYQKKAAGIFKRLLATHPDHPGIAHYLIHSFDYPALAPLALDAAYAYAKIAPSSPHALHMPSHIFVRLGMWPETIASNIASANASAELPGRLHAFDYLAYAYLQRGQDDKVAGLIADIAKIQRLDAENFQGYYSVAAIPARYAIERRHWSDAAALEVRTEGMTWDRFGYAEALTHFARAIGAARSGNAAAARKDLEALKALHNKLVEEKNAYWAGQVDVQSRAAEGWIAHAEGHNGDAVAMLKSAADLEDSMDKSPVTPGPIVPSREMLGDLLLELDQPQQALEAYERSLKDSPNRLNGLSGAARAAELSRDYVKARDYSMQVAKLLDR